MKSGLAEKQFTELNSIMQKMNTFNYKSLSTIMRRQNTYKFSEKLHEDYEYIEGRLSKGHKYDLTTSIFDKLPEIFLDDVDNKEDYMQIIGRSNGKKSINGLGELILDPTIPSSSIRLFSLNLMDQGL